MAIKDSLSEVSSSLAKILQQLKDIEEVQSRIERQAQTFGASARSASYGGQQTSVGGSGFSTPPPPPGSQLGGITADSAGGGGVAPPGSRAAQGVGSMLPPWAKPVAMAAAGAIDYAYAASPSVSDAYTNQNLRFRTSYMQPGGYRASDWEKMKALWGNKQSDPYGMVTASNVFSMSGMAVGTQSYDMAMTQASTVSTIFGTSAAEAAVGQAQLYSGSQASRLAQSGIFLSDFSTGKQKSLSQIVDDIWSRAFRKGPNGKVPFEGFNTAMQRGWLGAWLRRNFQEPLYSQIYQALYDKAKANGESLDYSKLEGQGSAYQAAVENGLTEQNAPYQTAMDTYGTQSNAIEAASGPLLTGYRAGSEAIQAQNNVVAGLSRTPPGALALVAKGAYQTLMTNPGFAALAGLLGGGVTGVLSTLFGGEGEEGTAEPTQGSGPGGGAGGADPAAMDHLAAIRATLEQMRDCVCGPMSGDFNNPGGGDFAPGGGGGGGEGTDLVDKSVGSMWGHLVQLKTVLDLLVSKLQGNPKTAPPGTPLPDWITGWLESKAGGGPITGAGSSTSDNVHALLSPGEYVINAAAAQAVGHKTLDAINSMGRRFGSAYASPARNFDGGGCVDGACPGDATMDGWTALGYGDPALKKFSVAGAPSFPNGGMWLLEESGIGQYLADFAAAYQAHPDLGGARLDLNEGASYGHALRAGAQGGISNHSAGVAMDLRHDEAGFPFTPDTYRASAAEKAAIESLLNRFPKLEWGGHWSPGSIDEMHFEIRDPQTWGKDVYTGAPPAEETTETTSTDGRQSGPGGARFGTGIKPSAIEVVSISGMGMGASLGLGLGSSFSWVTSLFGGPSSLGSGVGSQTTSVGQSGSAQSTQAQDSSSHPAPGDGSGPQWLYDFLVSKGVRGDILRTLWVISSRESGGNPNLVAAMDRGNFQYPDVPGDFNPDSENWRGGRYDVGLFQINSQHREKVRSMFGGDMLSMVDPNKNFDMMRSLSGAFSNWTPWGIAGVSPNGFSYIDWSTWGGSWASTWGPKTQERDAQFLQEYDAINVHGYSEGSYRTHNELARLHEGEMVLPAAVAEQFRQIMREAAVPGSRTGDVTINLKIEKASDEEAERFAKKVKKMLQEDDWMSSMRSR